uniref:Translation initiation factor eIF2B subunit beta n=1 Tax=Compsopogon caeruleus TaxID=31354 RepID=A0A7S1XEX6_9RHOD
MDTEEHILNSKAEEAVQDLIKRLSRIPTLQTAQAAILTARTLLVVVTVSRVNVAAALRAVGRRITAACQDHLIVLNVIRRVLRMVREEKERGEGEGHGVMDVKLLVQAIDDYIADVELSAGLIAEQAVDHLHANEVVFAFGWSRSVEAFLREAAKTRRFEVIVAENAPDCDGREFARALVAKATEESRNLTVTLIPDSAIFAVMGRVHKAIISAHAVMADGSIVAPSGIHLVTLAARHFSVPVVVCVGSHKLTPLFPHNRDALHDLLSPAAVLRYEEHARLGPSNVYRPAHDIIPPGLLQLFVTNLGGFSPSYIYRLINDHYDDIDSDL